MPAPKPKTADENPRSLFIVSAAKLMFTRSIYAMKYRSMMNGTMRHEILRNVRCSRSSDIDTSLETGEHTPAVRVVSSAFLAYSRRTAEQLLLYCPQNRQTSF